MPGGGGGASPGQGGVLRPETLVLTLPPDPDLAGLTRLVSSHFLRQNGVRAFAAKRGALTVEKGCRALLRAAARSGHSRRPLVLALHPRTTFLEVIGQAGGGPKTRLLHLARTP